MTLGITRRDAVFLPVSCQFECIHIVMTHNSRNEVRGKEEASAWGRVAINSHSLLFITLRVYHSFAHPLGKPTHCTPMEEETSLRMHFAFVWPAILLVYTAIKRKANREARQRSREHLFAALLSTIQMYPSSSSSLYDTL